MRYIQKIIGWSIFTVILLSIFMVGLVYMVTVKPILWALDSVEL